MTGCMFDLPGPHPADRSSSQMGNWGWGGHSAEQDWTLRILRETKIPRKKQWLIFSCCADFLNVNIIIYCPAIMNWHKCIKKEKQPLWMWLHKAGTCSSELSHTYSFPMLSAEHVYLYCESMHPTIKYPITNKTQRSYKMHFFSYLYLTASLK